MKVASFYRFLDLSDPESFCDALRTLCSEQQLLGTILVAGEGFNGTIAGSEAAIKTVIAWIEANLALDMPIDGRWTESTDAPFRHMRVRIKKEIVTLGRPDILPHKQAGIHVAPDQWNALIEDPNVLVCYTRNHSASSARPTPKGTAPSGSCSPTPKRRWPPPRS